LITAAGELSAFPSITQPSTLNSQRAENQLNRLKTT
jgi:hypothetical protein